MRRATQLWTDLTLLPNINIIASMRSRDCIS